MSIYDKASLVLIPSGTKTSKVYSQKPVNGDGDFTFSRSTAATRVNASGNIEKETQNLFTYSNNLSNPIWQLGVITATGGQSGYDSSSDAWLITKDANAYRAIEHDVNNSGVYTYSVYAKANTLDKIYLRNQTLGQGAYFDLTNGTTYGNSGLFSSIVSVGGGWYRCSVTFNGTSIRLAIYIDFDVATAGSVYVQDFQVEKGLVARDYIETTTAAVEGGITDNVPRLDYTDSSCPALLLEPLRTNYYTQSEYVQTGTRVTLANNATTSPEGVDNAASVIATSVSGSHEVLTGQITISGAGVITFSTFAKYNGNHLVLTKAYNSSNWTGCVFDLQNGVAKTPQNNGISDVCTADVEDYGNGWYRCSITFTPFASANQYIISLTDNVNATLGTWGADTYMGDDVSGIYLYGSQVEAGSYATSYIPTYGTSVTRNQDTYKKLGFGNTSTEGTFYAEFEVKKMESANGQYMYGLSVGTTDLGNFFATASGALSIITNGANIQGFNNGYADSLFSYTPSIGDTAKIAIRYDGSNVVAFVNGVKQTTKTDNASGVKNSIRVNHGEKSSHATKQLLFIPTALTDQEAIDLTTI